MSQWFKAGARLDSWRYPRCGGGFYSRFRAFTGSGGGSTAANEALARAGLALESFGSWAFNVYSRAGIYRSGYNPASPGATYQVIAVEVEYLAAGLYPATTFMRQRWDECSIPELGASIGGATILRGGLGYSPGDTLIYFAAEAAQGYSTSGASVVVSTVGSAGDVTAVTINSGSGNLIAANMGFATPDLRNTAAILLDLGTVDASRQWDFNGAPGGSLYTFDSTNTTVKEIDDTGNVYTLSPPASGFGYKAIRNIRFSCFEIYGSPDDVEDTTFAVG